jgi:hypothetical protein
LEHTEKIIERIEVRRTCRPENWSFTPAVNEAVRIILRKSLTHF